MKPRILSTEEIKTIYNKWAAIYDASLWSFYLFGFRVRAYRKAAVENLNLTPGDTVVDLGCGTGLNFGLLREKVGSNGSIIGIDLSDKMLRQAKNRADRLGWQNVTLVQADMAEYSFPPKTDGILSTLALTMSPEYDQVIQQAADTLEPGKRISIFELKKPEQWPKWLVRGMIALLKSYGVRSDHTERTPWRSVENHFPRSEMKEYYFGATYVVTGIA